MAFGIPNEDEINRIVAAAVAGALATERDAITNLQAQIVAPLLAEIAALRGDLAALPDKLREAVVGAGGELIDRAVEKANSIEVVMPTLAIGPISTRVK